MILDESDTIPGHVPAEDSAEKLEETGRAEEEDEHLPQTTWIPAPPAPQEERTEPSVRLTIGTSVVGRLRRKSATVSDQPASEWDQPSMNVVTVKFEGSKGKWMGTRSVFLWGPGFPVLLSRRIARRVSSLIGLH